MVRDNREKIGVTVPMRVSSASGRLYFNISKLAKIYGWKKGDLIQVELLYKILTTYTD